MESKRLGLYPRKRIGSKRSARSGCAGQYDSIGAAVSGGTNGRSSARARTAGGKIAGRALERRAKDFRFRSAFSACQLDLRLRPHTCIVAPEAKPSFTVHLTLFVKSLFTNSLHCS